MKLLVTYRSGLSELVEISLDKKFADLRQYFLDTEGHYAASVEILSVN